jgi:exodeoxyribonuclease III
VCTYVRKACTQSVDKNPVEGEQGRALLTKHDGFDLLNIYAPNAGRGEEYLKIKFAFYKQMKMLTQKYNNTQTGIIIAGDINTAHQDLDVYMPKKFTTTTGFLIEEREWITKWLKEELLVDSYRNKYPSCRESLSGTLARRNEKSIVDGESIYFMLVITSPITSLTQQF